MIQLFLLTLGLTASAFGGEQSDPTQANQPFKRKQYKISKPDGFSEKKPSEEPSRISDPVQKLVVLPQTSCNHRVRYLTKTFLNKNVKEIPSDCSQARVHSRLASLGSGDLEIKHAFLNITPTEETYGKIPKDLFKTLKNFLKFLSRLKQIGYLRIESSLDWSERWSGKMPFVSSSLPTFLAPRLKDIDRLYIEVEGKHEGWVRKFLDSSQCRFRSLFFRGKNSGNTRAKKGEWTEELRASGKDEKLTVVKLYPEDHTDHFFLSWKRGKIARNLRDLSISLSRNFTGCSLKVYDEFKALGFLKSCQMPNLQKLTIDGEASFPEERIRFLLKALPDHFQKRDKVKVTIDCPLESCVPLDDFYQKVSKSTIDGRFAYQILSHIFPDANSHGEALQNEFLHEEEGGLNSRRLANEIKRLENEFLHEEESGLNLRRLANEIKRLESEMVEFFLLYRQELELSFKKYPQLTAQFVEDQLKPGELMEKMQKVGKDEISKNGDASQKIGKMFNDQFGENGKGGGVMKSLSDGKKVLSQFFSTIRTNYNTEAKIEKNFEKLKNILTENPELEFHFLRLHLTPAEEEVIQDYIGKENPQILERLFFHTQPVIFN